MLSRSRYNIQALFQVAQGTPRVSGELRGSSENLKEVVRILRLFLVYLWSMGLFLCLIPALTVRIGYLLDSVLKLPKLNFGSANLILAGLLMSFGISWGAWSWYGLLTVGKGHPHEAFGAPLAPNTLAWSPPLTFRIHLQRHSFWTLGCLGRCRLGLAFNGSVTDPLLI